MKGRMDMDNVSHYSKETLDRYFCNLIENGISSCFSVGLKVGGQMRYSFLGGTETSDSNSRILTPETRFNIASVTKPITGALLIKLAEEGKLTLQDPVKNFIPEFKFEKTTLYHLLTHSAGYDEKIVLSRPKIPAERKTYFDSIYEIDKLKYPVGQISAYWSPDYSIVADVIERVTGSTLEEAACKCFHLLSMIHSTYDLSTLAADQYFTPWNNRTGEFVPDANNGVITGDTGVYTTASDLLKFSRMLLTKGTFNGERIFSKAATDLMLREFTGGRFHQSPVFWIKGEVDTRGCFSDFNSPKAAAHTGMTGCMLMIDPEYQCTAAILTNSVCLHENWNHYKRICNMLMAIATDTE